MGNGGAYQKTAAQAEADKRMMQDIVDGLALRVDQLVPQCLPKAVRSGDGWYIGSIEGEPGRSMKIWRRTGIWKDYNPGHRRATGDMLHLVTYCLFADKRADAIAWAKSELGLDDKDPERVRMTIRAAAEARARDFEAEQLKTRTRARDLWHGSRADPTPDTIEGTPAFSYLATRAIDLSVLGRIPRSLRYRPDVWCPVAKAKRPAMIACIMGLDGHLLGVHRTYLDIADWDHATRRGPVRNVKVEPRPGKIKSHKLTLGIYTGGCIPLWKGESRKTLREIEAGTPVFVSEGIEDGLSWAMAHPRDRVVAAVALANMGGLALPPQAGPLTIIMQNDPDGSEAVASLEGVIQRQQEAGRTVRLVRPPTGFKDFNDVLLGKTA